MALVELNRQFRPNQIKRSTDVRTPTAQHVQVKAQRAHTCKHGWEVPEELVTLTITEADGHREFRQVWRPMENAGCPDER